MPSRLTTGLRAGIIAYHYHLVARSTFMAPIGKYQPSLLHVVHALLFTHDYLGAPTFWLSR